MGAPQDVGFLAEGKLKFGLLASDGVTQLGLGESKNTVKFEYNPGAPTVKQRISKGINSYGRILDQVYIPKPSEMTLTFDTVDAQGLAQIFRGDLTALTVTGATVAPATFTVSTLDVYVPIAVGKRFLSAVTVTNTAGSTTYTEGTDYDVDYTLGFIVFYSAGAIAAGSIKVGYTYATYAGQTIAAEKFTQLNMQIAFAGKNLADGRFILVDVPKAVMAPTTAIDFMSENFANLELKGSPISVAGASPLTATYVTTVPTGF